jgi:hypothetical protein
VFFWGSCNGDTLIEAQKTLHIEQRNRGASSREMGLEAKQFGLQGLPLVRSKYEPELPPSLKVINSFFLPPTHLQNVPPAWCSFINTPVVEEVVVVVVVVVAAFVPIALLDHNPFFQSIN